MTTSHAEYLESAFLQLSFAIKLRHYMDVHPIDKEQFDISLTVEDVDNRICLARDEFKLPEDLLLAADNNISICFGVAAMTLWEAVDEKGVYSLEELPDPLETEQQKLTGLIYMIRCCFAHGTAVQRWDIRRERYRIEYMVGPKHIDLRNLHDTLFSYESIGGYETLWLLKGAAKSSGML